MSLKSLDVMIFAADCISFLNTLSENCPRPTVEEESDAAGGDEERKAPELKRNALHG